MVSKYGPRLRHGAYAGGKESAEHYVWRSMLARCSNPSNASFKFYGARGISVCERWKKFEAFFEDMGSRPNAALSLERIDTNAGYSVSNCIWATRSEQQKNKTSTRLYASPDFKGTLVECAEFVGISKELAFWRMKEWGTFEKETPWRELPKTL